MLKRKCETFICLSKQVTGKITKGLESSRRGYARCTTEGLKIYYLVSNILHRLHQGLYNLLKISHSFLGNGASIFRRVRLVPKNMVNKSETRYRLDERR